MNDIAIVEDLLLLNVHLYDIDIVNRNNICQLAPAECAETLKYYQTIEIKKSYMLRKQQKRRLPILSLP